MYVHSIRVPRLYKCAAKILQQAKENGGSVKKLIFDSKHANKKALCALVNEALRQFSVVDTLIEKIKLLSSESRCDVWLARILITELLWGKKQLPDQSTPTKTILKYKSKLEKYNLAISNSPTSDQAKVYKPRVVRVNTIATSIEKVVNDLKNEEWKLMPFAGDSYEDFVLQTASLSKNEFMIDLHFKELLQFPNGTEFYKHSLYKTGLIVLQDKASCLPTHLLNPEPGSTVLDMCAAPGMKTTHLAALMNNQGSIYAVERDAKRFETLNTMVKKAGASCVKTMHNDVLKVTASDCRNVKYILVDPSCSGSGMTDRAEFTNNSIPLEQRLKKLAGFQILILKHALLHFPDAQRVVYSTCSIHSKENEFVIQQVLKHDLDFKLVNAHTLMNSSWKSNNISDENWSGITENCLCMKPDKDLTNGFFVAVFERTRVTRRKTPKKGKIVAQKGNANKKLKGKIQGGPSFDVQELTSIKLADIKRGNKQKKSSKFNKTSTEGSVIATPNANRVVRIQSSPEENARRAMGLENQFAQVLLNEQLERMATFKNPKNISQQAKGTLSNNVEAVRHVTPMKRKSVPGEQIQNVGTGSTKKKKLKRSLS